MKTKKIHDILPCKKLPASSSKLNLDDYSFLSEVMKSKIIDSLNEVKVDEGDSPAGLYEEYCIMVKKKLDAIQHSINKMPDYTLDEFALRNEYGQLYMHVDTDLKTVPVANATYITREVPSLYDPEIIAFVNDAMNIRKNIVYVSLAIVFVLTFLFFITVGKDFLAFDSSLKFTCIAVFGIIVAATALMQNALSKFFKTVL